ncbi:cytochrome P450-dit2 [Steccherinum ochraceum]|uniref:Cytochrome P450-dit2 n=1 Tax=Steccherinum ochraceum TaxID=92696 RepID=A0A4R0RPV4_9APHY|nr:cytochrome P450-dit2 [Steccherinum ochraceum]
MQSISILLFFGAALSAWKLLSRYLNPGPLDNLPGPPTASWVAGNMRDLFDRFGWTFVDSLDAYGGVSKIHGMFGGKVLHVFDPLACHQILVKDSQAFEAPSWFLEGLKYIFGPGLGTTTGDVHRKQRQLITPAFSTEQMRNLAPIFFGVAQKLRDTISAEVLDSSKELDMFHLTGRAALEIIGQGGLGYSFDPLTQVVHNTFAEAVKALVRVLVLAPCSAITLTFIPPPLQANISEDRTIEVFSSILQILRTSILPAQVSSTVTFAQSQKTGEHNRHHTYEINGIGEGKDIMSILLKANMAASTADRLPDEEIVAQMSSFIFAGTDTTSAALTQVIHMLAVHTDVQEKLRSEIQPVLGEDGVSYDEINALPYLDAVCRETLRLYPSTNFVAREAIENTSLSFYESVRGLNGETMSGISVPKGTVIMINLRASNRNKATWGEDAHQWRPDRWLSPLPSTLIDARVPGVYSHLLTFTAGARSCLGFRFAELEMKVILSTLLSSFKFSVSDKEIVWNMAGVRFPTAGKESIEPSLSYLLWKVTRQGPSFSHLDNLPGPRGQSWFMGCLKQLFDRHGWTFLDELSTSYGGVFRIPGLCGTSILHVHDPAALQHIFAKEPHSFEEPGWVIDSNQILLGPGVGTTVGDAHRKQRRMLGPAFSTENMRHLTPVFYAVVKRLTDAIEAEIQDEAGEVNILGWMNRAALEMIGQGGLGPLLFEIGPLMSFSPFMSLNALGKVADEIHKMSVDVLQAKKDALSGQPQSGSVAADEAKSRDIISILVRGNMSPSTTDRLSDEEVLAQMSTLAFAATDTSAAALAQMLQELSEHPDEQQLLRREAQQAYEAHGEEIPHDDLLALPYLDAVVRETLRLYPPATFVARETVRDTLIPTSEPIHCKNGETINQLLVARGTSVLVSIYASNRSKTIWGEDVLQWKPERWLQPLPKGVVDARVPGIYSNLTTLMCRNKIRSAGNQSDPVLLAAIL